MENSNNLIPKKKYDEMEVILDKITCIINDNERIMILLNQLVNEYGYDTYLNVKIHEHDGDCE